MQLPWITRKEAERAVKDAQAVGDKKLREHVATTQRLLDEAHRENEQERNRLAEMLRMGIKYYYERTNGGNYRVMVEINPEVLRMVRPGDQEAVRYLAQRMGREFERELLTLNFMRFAKAVPQ